MMKNHAVCARVGFMSNGNEEGKGMGEVTFYSYSVTK